MNDTLAALEAAIVENPADRTARLVFADALDEGGDPAAAARAEFIRAQIELESAPGEPRRTELVAHSDELFAANWVAWWSPVCAAAGLPEPHVPQQRLRDRVRRFVRGDQRPPGAPYARAADIPGAYSVCSDELGFTAQFVGGFPELLAVHGGAGKAASPPEPGAGLRGLLARMPVRWLRFLSAAGDREWEAFDCPHLSKLSELQFDRMPEPLARRVARCEHLRNLPSLTALLVRGAEGALRAAVERPAWGGLRSLTLMGITPPAAVRALAERCTLSELESLTLGVAEVPEPPNVDLTGALGNMFNELLSHLFSPLLMPAGPIRWEDYWPALEALARSPVLPRLRVLEVCEGDPGGDPVQRLLGQFRPDGSPVAPWPDSVVMALAGGLNPDKLERLDLPAARLSPAARAALAARFGSRAALIG
jgi:uncharacterized protein (TIGR02996 family)